MISFQDGPKPRNYLSRGEQRRILFLVLTLGLVLILMFEAAKVENWKWFADLDKNNEPSGVGFLPADEENAEQSPDVPQGPFPGVDEKLLDTITDNTLIRNEENPAFFNLLGVLRRSDESDLRQASTGRVTWLQLNEQSDEYRGELVTVRGTIRRAHRLDAPKNDEGIEGYYQLWLQPDDNQKQPIVVYCLELPSAFPNGMDISERARATGFYFKQWLYKGNEDLQIAPVLLAKTVAWQKKADAPAEKMAPVAVNSIYFLVSAAAVLSLLAIGYIIYCTRGRPTKEENEPVDLDFDIILNSQEESEHEQEKDE